MAKINLGYVCIPVPRAHPQYYSGLLEDGVAGESTISGDDHKPGGGEEDKV